MEMTRDEITEKWDGMTPRERDAWVAEVVYGIDVHCEYSPEGPVYLDAKTLLNGREHIREYTTRISTAWEVVDTFFMFSVEGLANRYGYECTIWNEYGLQVCRVHGDSAPEAICLAALIAKLTK